jgi:hypothetical protein
MIYGIGQPKIVHKYNDYNSAELYFDIAKIPHTLVTNYNIPDIILQKAVNGRIIKILKGYYHEFTITIYNITTQTLAFLTMISDDSDNNTFYPHSDNLDFFFKINSVSAPFNLGEVNGNPAVRVTIESVGYESLVESNIVNSGGTGTGGEGELEILEEGVL